MLPDLHVYERFVYTLQSQFPVIRQSTLVLIPHHKHVPPNIKRHRIPAPGISFTAPNLPFLIEEIEQHLLGSAAG